MISEDIEMAIRNANKLSDNALLNEFFKGLKALGIIISIDVMTPNTGLKRVLTMTNNMSGAVYKAALEFEIWGKNENKKN